MATKVDPITLDIIENALKNARFEMDTASLRLVGLGLETQSLEVMSTDIGPDPDGLDRTLPGRV